MAAMRWLLDQGLPLRAAVLLRSRGEEAIHVSEIGMAKTADELILKHAAKEARVVVTLDADFHAILALSGAKGPSVIRFRVEGLTAKPASDLVLTIGEKFAAHLLEGCVISCDEEKVRIRKLPLE
jgi:predicted nuclease of predicted toxin-antitoxin system